MIARITGVLQEITKASALIDTGSGLWYEVLVPAFSLERLSRRLGQEVALYTIHYLEGDPSYGQTTPRLVGFAAEEDRAFFQLFTTVKGIGMRKALRAMARPAGEVAAAIQAKDAKMLSTLPEIGKRTAERIIAELHDKVDAFAGGAAAMAARQEEIPEAGQEAIAVLVQLGERRADAAALVERALAVAPETQTPEEIIQHVYKLKAGGK